MRKATQYSIYCLLLLSPGLRCTAQTVTCPAPRRLVKVTAKATVTFDPGTKLYTYQYIVTSDASSRQEVESVGIDFAPPVQNITHPRGWMGRVFPGRNTVLWAAIAAAPLPPGTPDRGQVPPGLFQIKPGNSMAGFSFQSPNPPGPVNSYALGFADIGAAASESEAEAIADNCPNSAGGFFDLAVVGAMEGPVRFIPVQIAIKPGASPRMINPSQGLIPVAILSSPSFNATTVDPSTVRFGPAGAAPVDAGKLEDVNHDGLPDLLFQFPASATGIVCGDTFEVLKGKTLSGKPIEGSDTVVTVDCRK